MVSPVHLPLAVDAPSPSFAEALRSRGLAPLRRDVVRTLQINVGKLCNMACHHCHVDAGPKRTEIMPRTVAERVIRLLDASPGVELVDITGGAPELNPSFRFLVAEARRRGCRVIDRCNLTVLLEPGMEDLPTFLAESGVAVVASLPCYGAENVDAQRGRGAFDKSVAGLRALNQVGFGVAGRGLRLDLVYNPVGPSLPPAQAGLEARYKDELARRFGISFDRLLTLANMPISRFAHALTRDGRYQEYMALLVRHFNAATVDGLMCRSLVSVGWDGALYDCDFNQMLSVPLGGDTPARPRPTIWDVADLATMTGRSIGTGAHCFGCTAGAGSSCSGAVVSVETRSVPSKTGEPPAHSREEP